MFDNTVNSLRDVFKNQVEVKLVFLGGREEAVFERDDVRVVEQPHGLKLTVLVPPVLQNFLYRNGFSCLEAFRLEDNAERTVANNTFGHVADRLHLAFEWESKPKQKKETNEST